MIRGSESKLKEAQGPDISTSRWITAVISPASSHTRHNTAIRSISRGHIEQEGPTCAHASRMRELFVTLWEGQNISRHTIGRGSEERGAKEVQKNPPSKRFRGTQHTRDSEEPDALTNTATWGEAAHPRLLRPKLRRRRLRAIAHRSRGDQ